MIYVGMNILFMMQKTEQAKVQKKLDNSVACKIVAVCQ